MKGRAFLAFLAMLVMLAAAFGIGAYRGYFDEKVQVELALSSLNEVLNTRIEMAHNLLTVASRHLPQDEGLIQAVKGHIAALSGQATLEEKAAANTKLTQDSKALLAKLEALPSVMDDQRDYRYATGLLPRGFEQSASWSNAEAYNAAALDFNKRLNGTANGFVAKLLGIQAAQTFGLAGGEQ